MKRKDKKAEERLKRQQLKEERQKAKRRKQATLTRETPERTEKQYILIVCEGKNTEPSYFNHFKLSTAVIKSVGLGYNTISLVKKAVELAKEYEYNQVWCVFDKDDFPAQDFNNAIFLAKDKGFGIAYSNQAFEYWLILHFEDHQGGAMHRDQYADKLNKYLKDFGLKYDKESKEITANIFDVLQSKFPEKDKTRQAVAIERAERIYNTYDHRSPAEEESSTSIFELMKEIDKYT